MWLLPLLAVSVSAQDEPFAEVSHLWETDAAGRWNGVKSTAEAVLRPGEPAADVPLEKGMALASGQHLVARLARAEITLSNGNELTLDPGSEVRVHEPTVVEQLVGKVRYAVEGAFSVKYGTVYCTVEGTEFDVTATPAGVGVGVSQGKVRVKTPVGEVLLPKGKYLEVAADGTLGEQQSFRYCSLCGFPHVPH